MLQKAVGETNVEAESAGNALDKQDEEIFAPACRKHAIRGEVPFAQPW